MKFREPIARRSSSVSCRSLTPEKSYSPENKMSVTMTYFLLLPKTLVYHILSLIILIALGFSSGQIRPQGWTYTVPLSALSSLLVEVCAIGGSCSLMEFCYLYQKKIIIPYVSVLKWKHEKLTHPLEMLKMYPISTTFHTLSFYT